MYTNIGHSRSQLESASMTDHHLYCVGASEDHPQSILILSAQRIDWGVPML